MGCGKLPHVHHRAWSESQPQSRSEKPHEGAAISAIRRPGPLQDFMLPWWRKGSGRAWPASPWHRRLPLSFAAFHVMKCLLSVPSTGGVIENCFTQHLQYCQSQEESSSESSRFEIQVEDSQEACRKCRNRIEVGILKTERESRRDTGRSRGCQS